MLLISVGGVLGIGVLVLIGWFALMMVYGNSKDKSRKSKAEELAKNYDFDKHPFCIEFNEKYGISFRKLWEIRKCEIGKSIGLFEKQADNFDDVIKVRQLDRNVILGGELCNYDYSLYLINENLVVLMPDTCKIRHKKHSSNPVYKMLVEDHWDEKFLKLLNVSTIKDCEQFIIPIENIAIRYANNTVLTKNPKSVKSIALDGAIWGTGVFLGELIDRANQPDIYQTNCNAYKFIFARKTNIPDLYKYAEGSDLYRIREKETFDKLLSYLKK